MDADQSRNRKRIRLPRPPSGDVGVEGVTVVSRFLEHLVFLYFKNNYRLSLRHRLGSRFGRRIFSISFGKKSAPPGDGGFEIRPGGSVNHSLILLAPRRLLIGGSGVDCGGAGDL